MSATLPLFDGPASLPSPRRKTPAKPPGRAQEPIRAKEVPKPPPEPPVLLAGAGWVLRGPSNGAVLIDVQDIAAASGKDPASAVRGWGQDGLDFAWPRPLGAEQVRWSVRLEGLAYLSIRTDDGRIAWLSWNGTAFQDAEEAVALTWGPGQGRELLPLQGNPSQIAWATTIRAEYARRYPKNTVPENTSADWWIRRRHSLGVP